jgi:hypothetical protein
MEFKKVLKILAKEGYPNPKLDNIFDAIDYDGENFLIDLVENLGKEGATDFVRKALNKLSSGISSEIKIRIPHVDDNPNSWVDLVIFDFWIDLDDETDTDIVINYGWGDNKVYDNKGNETTLEDLSDDVGLGGMGEWEDYMDWIRSAAYNYISKRCGFGIWYQ